MRLYQHARCPRGHPRLPSLARSAVWGLVLALVVLSTACIGLPSGTERSDRVAVVGFLAAGSPTPSQSGVQLGLHSAGYDEGRNLVMERRYAMGNAEALPGLVVELIARGATVIIAADTASTRAAMNRAPNTPVVMVVVGDPVGSGFVQSFAQPGGNVTGLTNAAPELATKRLELLQQTLPDIEDVAVIVNPTNPASERVLQELTDACPTFHIRVHPIVVRRADELEAGFATAAAQGVQAVVIVGDPLFVVLREQITQLAEQHRLPIQADLSLSGTGAMLVYGADFTDLYRRSAFYATKILQGASPADLPVEQPTKFELTVNLQTAEALGIDIPSSVLLQADRIVR